MRRLTAIMGSKIPSTKQGEMVSWDNCIASYLPNKGAYALQLKGATYQNGTPTTDNPIPIQCVKQGTKVKVCGKNLLEIPNKDGGTVETPCDLYEGDTCYWYGDRTEVVHSKGIKTYEASQIRFIGGYTNLDYAEVQKPINSADYKAFNTAVVTSEFAVKGNTGYGYDNVIQINKILGSGYHTWWTGFPKGTTEEQMRTAMASKKIVYELATPTTEIFPAQPILRTFNGTINILQEPTDLNGTIKGTVLVPKGV